MNLAGQYKSGSLKGYPIKMIQSNQMVGRGRYQQKPLASLRHSHSLHMCLHRLQGQVEVYPLNRWPRTSKIHSFSIGQDAGRAQIPRKAQVQAGIKCWALTRYSTSHAWVKWLKLEKLG